MLALSPVWSKITRDLHKTQQQDIVKIYSLLIIDGYGEDIEKVYISTTEKKLNARKISPDMELAKMLIDKNVGCHFKIKGIEYLIEDIEGFNEVNS